MQLSFPQCWHSDLTLFQRTAPSPFSVLWPQNWEMASQAGYTLSASGIGPAQGLQMVLLIELECSRVVAKRRGARFLFCPLQNRSPETESRNDPNEK